MFGNPAAEVAAPGTKGSRQMGEHRLPYRVAAALALGSSTEDPFKSSMLRAVAGLTVS
jgi:hypothetical protein